MSRLRIVFAIGALHGGGSERQIISALQHLDRERFEPHLYMIYRSGPLLPLVPDDVPIAVFDERDPRSPSPMPGQMHRRRVSDMRRFLQQLQADVCYDRTFLMTLVAAEAAGLAGVPAVSTIVTNPSTGFAPVAGRFQWFKKRSLRRLYRQAASVLAVSAGAARDAEQFYGLAANTVATLYNGVDQQAIRTAATADVDSPWWTTPGTRPVVRLVSAGRLNHEKGFHLLIDAVSRLQRQDPETEFRLALLGEGDHRLSLQQQIDDANMTGQICLAGFRTEAPAWYRSADLYVSSSLVEGMPNVLLEAMACGTPVVASRCPHGPEEVLDQGRCGLLVDVNSAEALANGIREALDNPKKTQQRQRAADQQLSGVFSQESAVRHLEQVLSAAAESGRAAQNH